MRNLKTPETQQAENCLLYLLTGDVSYLDRIWKPRRKKRDCAWLSSWKPSVMEMNDTRRRRGGVKISRKRDTSVKVFCEGKQESLRPQLSAQDWGNYKGARVMRAQTKEAHKSVRFNHTDWASGNLKKSGWTEVYFRSSDEKEKRRAHLSER